MRKETPRGQYTGGKSEEKRDFLKSGMPLLLWGRVVAKPVCKCCFRISEGRKIALQLVFCAGVARGFRLQAGGGKAK